MKSTDPSLARAIMQKVMRHEDFHTVAELVSRNTAGRIFLVGGKVYRTAIELIHGYDCKSEQADWDFLCVGEVTKPNRVWLSDNWQPDDNEYEDYKEHSLCLKHYPQMNKTAMINTIVAFKPMPEPKKIDIIGIKDIVQATPNPSRPNGSLDDYLNIVPLTIQACALTTHQAYPTLYGEKAIKSIETKTIEVNNAEGALPNLNLPRYIREKAESLQFAHGNGRTKVPCDCFGNDHRMLWRLGCQHKLTHV